MEFLTPWSLLALLAIPCIVLLHVVRPARKTVRIASNALWREVLHERRSRLGWARLIKNISLIILLLFALMSALALAEPQWLTRTVGRYDAVVVIDVSASMAARSGTTTRFARAIAEARALIASLPAGGRMLLMTSGAVATLRSSFESDAERLYQALDNIVATDETGRPVAALELARTLLSERERSRVYFITDRAFDVPEVNAHATSALGSPALSQVQLIDVGSDAANVAITRFDLRAQIGSAERYQVFLTVANFGPEPVRVPVAVTLDNVALIERVLTLAPGANERVIATFAGNPEGYAKASVEVDDALASDNYAYAVMERERGRLVALFSRGNVYLQSLLGAFPNTVVTRIQTLDQVAFATHAQWNDLVIVDGFDTPPLPAGRFLLFGSPPPGMGVEAHGTTGQVTVSGTGHSALVRGIDFSGVSVDRAVKVASAGQGGQAPIDALPGVSVQRLFWSDETPLALSLIDSHRRAVWLGFDPRESSFPLQAAYPLFIANAIEWLAPQHAGAGAGPAGVTQIAAGTRYVIRVPPEVTHVAVTAPGGGVRRLAAARGKAVAEDTSKAGIYRVSAGAERSAFAVNLTSSVESDLAPRAPLHSSTTRQNSGSAQHGIALWPMCVIAAIVLLLAEWFLVGARQLYA